MKAKVHPEAVPLHCLALLCRGFRSPVWPWVPCELRPLPIHRHTDHCPEPFIHHEAKFWTTNTSSKICATRRDPGLLALWALSLVIVSIACGRVSGTIDAVHRFLISRKLFYASDCPRNIHMKGSTPPFVSLCAIGESNSQPTDACPNITSK